MLWMIAKIAIVALVTRGSRIRTRRIRIMNPIIIQTDPEELIS